MRKLKDYKGKFPKGEKLTPLCDGLKSQRLKNMPYVYRI